MSEELRDRVQALRQTYIVAGDDEMASRLGEVVRAAGGPGERDARNTQRGG
jgi:hypothetical protein